MHIQEKKLYKTLIKKRIGELLDFYSEILQVFYF